MSQKILYGDDFIFTSRNSTGTISISAGAGEVLEINGSAFNYSGMYMTDASQLFGLIATFVALDIPTTIDDHNSNFTLTSAGKLTYTGVKAGTFVVYYNISQSGTSGDVITMGTAINGGAPNNASLTSVTLPAASAVINATHMSHLSMNPGDFVMIVAKNSTGIHLSTFTKFSISIFSV